MLRNGVFHEGKRIGGFDGSRVIVILNTAVRVVELSPEDARSLDVLDTKHLPNQLSAVWRAKVEPEIDRLVEEDRLNQDRVWREKWGISP